MRTPLHVSHMARRTALGRCFVGLYACICGIAYLALVGRLILDKQLVVVRLDYSIVRKVVCLSCTRYFCLHVCPCDRADAVSSDPLQLELRVYLELQHK
jgi:hypothetical protein